MNNKAVTISTVLALLAAFLVWSSVSSIEENTKAKFGASTKVMIAKTDIREMSEIHENMIEASNIPKAFTQPGITTSKEELVGFIASVPIRKGEQITLNKVVAPGVKTGIARQITPGKRAMSLPVDDVSGVGRLLKPGDRIDLLVTMEPPGAQRGNQVTKMVLQDVPILAVGEFILAQAPRRIEKDATTGQEHVVNLATDRSYGNVTIEVDPQQAVQVALIRDMQARLSILLRNNDDAERVQVSPATVNDILNVAPRVPAALK